MLSECVQDGKREHGQTCNDCVVLSLREKKKVEKENNAHHVEKVGLQELFNSAHVR